MRPAAVADTLHLDEATLVEARAAGPSRRVGPTSSTSGSVRRTAPIAGCCAGRCRSRTSGRIVQWYGAGTDIDDLKGAEAALRESEAFLAEAQRLSRTGSFGWDLSRAELRCSEETFRIFEFDPEGEAPTVEHVIRRTHPDDLDTVRQAIHRVTHDKETGTSIIAC